MEKPKHVEFFEVDGKKYEITYFGISYRCEALKIYGERTYISCRNSIKRKIKQNEKFCYSKK